VSSQEQTCIDLFCGCGGLTLGMQRAGFRVLAAIDCNPEAVATLRANLVEQNHAGLIPVSHALQRDLSEFGPAELALLLGVSHVDVIVGGPPCQGFSTARRVDGANNGARLKPDPRRELYREFLRYVDFFQPRVFVIENVLGIRSASGGEYFTRAQKEARELGRAAGRPGYRVHGQVEDAWELGVPQKRHRQLIIGVRNDLPGYFLPDLKPAARAQPRTCLGVAIGDLPILRAGGGEDERAYDIPRRLWHVHKWGDAAHNYLSEILEIDRAAKLTNHVARPHSDRDLRDFARLKEGENSKVAIRDRGVTFEFPYNKDHFKDRYTRQSRQQPCSTIVAHLSKDGLMFVHPTQTRSLTPREAARVQSFPDWFKFPPIQTQTFRLIGNAVPPLVGQAESCCDGVRPEWRLAEITRDRIRRAMRIVDARFLTGCPHCQAHSIAGRCSNHANLTAGQTRRARVSLRESSSRRGHIINAA
jgi:DNA (cytosine-5)-methyltransferase 1